MLYLFASVRCIYADDLYTDYVHIYSNCIRILMFKRQFFFFKQKKTDYYVYLLLRFCILIVTISILT